MDFPDLDPIQLFLQLLMSERVLFNSLSLRGNKRGSESLENKKNKSVSIFLYVGMKIFIFLSNVGKNTYLLNCSYEVKLP